MRWATVDRGLMVALERCRTDAARSGVGGGDGTVLERRSVALYSLVAGSRIPRMMTLSWKRMSTSSLSITAKQPLSQSCPTESRLS